MVPTEVPGVKVCFCNDTFTTANIHEGADRHILSFFSSSTHSFAYTFLTVAADNTTDGCN